MRRLINPADLADNLRHTVGQTLLVAPVGLIAGSASAFFLWSLDQVTAFRLSHYRVVWLLPLAGFALGLLYHRFGKSAEGGNNLILDRIHTPGGGVPRRMAPLVLLGTLITHLFGGSAGREGTAVQMGGSLASAYGRLCRFGENNMRVLLMSGVAAGFGSVFGTPLTGAVFAMEVLVVGRMQYDALIPVLVASLVGDLTCAAWGTRHTAYHIAFATNAAHETIGAGLLAKVALASMAFGLTSRLFAELTHRLQHGFQKLAPAASWRAALGGACVIALIFVCGTDDYLGLGVSSANPHAVTLLSSFREGGADTWSWAWKLLFTSVTLASGFKGGEVTPLFFIGAALGNTLAVLTGAPVDLFAGLGFIAVFSGATNTPLACTIMGIELFGAHHAVYFATACFVAYHFSGHSGIYVSQRLGVPKRRQAAIPPDLTLREVGSLEDFTAGARLARLSERWGTPFSAPPPSTSMSTHHIVSREMGKIRIYLSPRDRRASRGWLSRLSSKPHYREIIMAAKADGLRNAAVFMTHYGFSAGGRIEREGIESPNPDMVLCVEIIDRRRALEDFCHRHALLLEGKTIVYKHVEHWALHDGALSENDSSPDEVIDGDKTALPPASTPQSTPKTTQHHEQENHRKHPGA